MKNRLPCTVTTLLFVPVKLIVEYGTGHVLDEIDTIDID